MAEDQELSSAAVAALDAAHDCGERVALSPISAWEIGTLASRGRFASPLTPQAWFHRFASNGGFRLTALTPDVLIASSFLPGSPPSDPIDRILIAAAREEGMALVTRDRAMIEYGRAGHV